MIFPEHEEKIKLEIAKEFDKHVDVTEREAICLKFFKIGVLVGTTITLEQCQQIISKQLEGVESAAAKIFV